MMRGGTLFSGIGAPECAVPEIDWRWGAEIDAFASAVHAEHIGTRNLGDVTRIDPDDIEPVDLVVFGSPCQSFSVAGKRLGLDDPRGNLALIALRLIDRIRPRWLVFENVPGLLSSDGTRDFGTFLGTLGQCGYGFAYRVLDAQYAGVPQRRRRVFVVGYLGDWRPPAAVLFERESLRGDTPPRREAGQGIAASLAPGTGGGSGHQYRQRGGKDQVIACVAARGAACSHDPTMETFVPVAFGGNNQSGPIDTATACNAHGGPHGRQDFETETFVTHSLRADGFDASEDGTGRGTPLVVKGAAIGREPHNGPQYGEILGDGTCYTLNATEQHAVAFHENQRAEVTTANTAGSLKVGGGKPGQGYPALQSGMSVRRLTPVECEKLQGFPPQYTAITYRGKPAADGPRYRVLGNSMAVPVVRWILDRIRQFDAFQNRKAA